MSMQQKTVYVIGHKNPDTDSVVSSVAYATLKTLLGQQGYIAARAGRLAPQTEYIFNRFAVPYPKYTPDLVPKVAYYMSPICQKVTQDCAVWDAVEKMNQSKARALPVVDENGKYKALLHYSIFAKSVLSVLKPEHRASFPTNIALITHTLSAQPLVIFQEHCVFRATVLVGASNVETFKETLKSHKAETIVVIASDRCEIQEAAIKAQVRLLIVTSNYPIKKELRELAKQKKVSLISSPYGTSSTSMLIAYPTSVLVMADRDIKPVHKEDTVAKIRPLLQESPCRCLPVVDQDNNLIGLISEHDLLKEPNIELILVDHNDSAQAVEGIENYRIQEIIDHHQLGNITTTYPIMFINKPVGSTATLIAELYRQNRVALPLDMACLLLCGILSDTLVLKSTTTTTQDKETASYLCDITNLDIETLGHEIIAAGSHIKGRSANDLIHQDMKEYTQGKTTYTVSQIEVDDTKEPLERKQELLKELEIERRAHKAIFSALLITDITQLSSLLLFCCDEKTQSLFNFPRIEPNVYFLKDIVSRKKQLIPLLTEQIQLKCL